MGGGGGTLILDSEYLFGVKQVSTGIYTNQIYF